MGVSLIEENKLSCFLINAGCANRNEFRTPATQEKSKAKKKIPAPTDWDSFGDWVRRGLRAVLLGRAQPLRDKKTGIKNAANLWQVCGPFRLRRGEEGAMRFFPESDRKSA